MREMVIQSGRTPGKNENPFYDMDDDEVVDPLTPEKAMGEVVSAIKVISEKIASSPAYSHGTTTYGNPSMFSLALVFESSA